MNSFLVLKIDTDGLIYWIQKSKENTIQDFKLIEGFESINCVNYFEMNINDSNDIIFRIYYFNIDNGWVVLTSFYGGSNQIKKDIKFYQRNEKAEIMLDKSLIQGPVIIEKYFKGNLQSMEQNDLIYFDKTVKIKKRECFIL
jgi:hypothetical protein